MATPGVGLRAKRTADTARVKSDPQKHRVVLVGTGFISHVHAEAMRGIPGAEIHGVIDRRDEAARAFAAKWCIPKVFHSIDEAVRSGEVNCAHVLTPPDLHAVTARPLLEAGIPCLIEKPLATDRAECEVLRRAAAQAGVGLGVNQNFVYHPAFRRLRRLIEERHLGPLNSLNCVYNMPLRQIAARQFSHWMFEKPINLLLEQAVHPLSQVVVLAGTVKNVRSIQPASLDSIAGVDILTRCEFLLQCDKASAVVQWAVGQSFPHWTITAICDDGVAVADIAYNRFFTYERTRWIEACDHFLSGMRTAVGIARESSRNLTDYAASLMKLTPRNDAFFTSMRCSIAAFHKALDLNAAPELDGSFGASVVGICEEIAGSLPLAPPKPTAGNQTDRYDILVLGGTGFIGGHVVKRLLAGGHSVGVMARNPRNLGPPFEDRRVSVIRGDVCSKIDVDRAVSRARIVVNLAHGSGSGSYSEIRRAMVGSAELVARACIEHGIERLVHIGSIAALYLGPSGRAVTGTTLPDPQAHRRSDYARAKAECDRCLIGLHASEGLPVCILRPGVVVGEQGIANHGALGIFNNDQYCIGWNSGNNPLPFVLVEDVAEAVFLACTNSKVVGHCYNLVGDVRLTAREYLRELGRELGRPIQYHPKNPNILWLQEFGKWLAKTGFGRRGTPPTRRDLLSRGLRAAFDCSDVKEALGWRPIDDRELFINRAIGVHAPRAP